MRNLNKILSCLVLSCLQYCSQTLNLAIRLFTPFYSGCCLFDTFPISIFNFIVTSYVEMIYLLILFYMLWAKVVEPNKSNQIKYILLLIKAPTRIKTINVNYIQMITSDSIWLIMKPIGTTRLFWLHEEITEITVIVFHSENGRVVTIVMKHA